LKEECQEKKCSRQPVLNAEKNAMSHSNPTPTDQFTAANAGLKNGPQDQETGTKPLPYNNPLVYSNFLSIFPLLGALLMLSYPKAKFHSSA
jgi:hypothetical protein